VIGIRPSECRPPEHVAATVEVCDHGFPKWGEGAESIGCSVTVEAAESTAVRDLAVTEWSRVGWHFAGPGQHERQGRVRQLDVRGCHDVSIVGVVRRKRDVIATRGRPGPWPRPSSSQTHPRQ
jgi:hypothetical protein